MNKFILLIITIFLLKIAVPGAQAQDLTVKDGSLGQMMNATKQMQEMNQSFNIQYLMLQQQIQQDTRQFDVISNVLVEKHQQAEDVLNGIG